METDREKQGLKGAVKSVLVETARFEEQGGQVTEQPWFSQTMNFNEDGWLIEQTYRNPDGSEARTVSDYADSQKLLTTRHSEASGALVQEVRYIYDDEESLVAEQHITPDGKITTTLTYSYDISGRKTQIKELDYSGDATLMLGVEGTVSTINVSDASRIETRYDDRGKTVQVKIFDSAGSIVSRLEIIRDPSGNVIEETQYHGDVVRFGPGSSSSEEIESLSEEEKAEFAAAVAEFFSPGTVMSKQTHEYDADGRLIESNVMMMGMAISRQTFAYDEAGNKAEEITYSEYAPVGGKSIFTRDYDEHGNWTKELVSTISDLDVSKPAHVTRRTITYYT